MPLSAAQYARLIGPLGPQTTQQSGVRTRVMMLKAPATAGLVTYSRIGFTPKGLMQIGSPSSSPTGPTTAGTLFHAGWGAYDGTQQVHSSSMIRDGLGTACYNAFVTDITIGQQSSGGGFQLRGVVSGFSSADGGSFTVNWGTVTAGAMHLTVLVIGGDDVQFKCGWQRFGTATGNLVVTSGLSFQPNLVGIMVAGAKTSITSGINSTSGDHYVSFGWATADAEHAAVAFARNGSALGVSSREYRDALAVMLNDATEKVRCSLASLNTNGFTISRDVNDGTLDTHFLWVAISAPGVKVGTIDTPAARGATTIAVPGIVPRSALLFGAETTTDGVVEREAYITVGATDGAVRASYCGHVDEGTANARGKGRGDPGHLYRAMSRTGANTYVTGTTINGVRLDPESLTLHWDRINPATIRVLQSVSATATPVTIAATTAGSTLLVSIAHSSTSWSTPFAPNDATNGAYTQAVASGINSFGAYVYYFHNTAAGVTSVNLGHTGGPPNITVRVIELTGLSTSDAPLTDLKAGLGALFHHVLAEGADIGTSREGYIAGAAACSAAVTGAAIPPLTAFVTSSQVVYYGFAYDGFPSTGTLKFGMTTNARSINHTVTALFRAPTVPRKIGYVVFGEASSNDLSVNVHDTVSVGETVAPLIPVLSAAVADNVSVADAVSPPAITEADNLILRSQAGLPLFWLRGGLIDTDLDAPESRDFLLGLYVGPLGEAPLGNQTFVKVGGTWKVATWYVKAGGAWQPGAPRVKAGGTWEG